MLLLRADVIRLCGKSFDPLFFPLCTWLIKKKFHSFGCPRSRNFREIALARPISKMSKLNRDMADVSGHILVLFTRLL